MTAHLTKVENTALHLSQQVAYQKIEMAKLKEENKKLTEQVAKLTQDFYEMQVKSTWYPIEFTMHNFKQYQTPNETWNSPSFYTHQKGYKMRLQIFPNGTSYDNYLSVRIMIIQGEYDEQLEWPFQGGFEVQLLNQRAGNNYTVVIAAPPPQLSTQIKFEEQQNNEWEESCFIAHWNLQPYFLINDCIKIRIRAIHIRNKLNLYKYNIHDEHTLFH